VKTSNLTRKKLTTKEKKKKKKKKPYGDGQY
jgi:hypothetical protein